MSLQLDDYENGRVNIAKEKGFWHNVRKYLREYNEVTGIHGLRYITEKRSRVEKCVWAIVLLISLAWCIYMIYEIVEKYQNSPVVVSFATKETPIYEIPFSAVTICPENKVSKTEFGYSEVYMKFQANETVTEEEFLRFQYMSLLCDEEKEYTDESLKTIDYNSFFDKLIAMEPRFALLCLFMEKSDDSSLNRDKFLTPIITDQGICYSFNIINRSEIFRDHVVHYKNYHQVENDSHSFNGESGYAKDAGVEVYPRRALISGADNSLAVFLAANREDTDYLCSNFHQGFRIMVHNPMEIPRLSKHYFRIPLDKSVVVAIQPELITTSDTVKGFSPEKRQCYFQSERPLRHFRVYTQSNCLLECATNYTLKQCGCVDFYMPRDHNTAICGPGNLKCVNKAENELKIKELENKIFKSDKFKQDSCDCKPLCTDLKYNVETSQSDFVWREYFALHKNINITVEDDDDNQEDVSYSVLSIYFKSEQFITLERNELYGISDLISNFGGLLGLFTGFSLISLVEIIYFLTLRIFYNERLYGMWSGPPS